MVRVLLEMAGHFTGVATRQPVGTGVGALATTDVLVTELFDCVVTIRQRCWNNLSTYSCSRLLVAR